MASAKVEVYVSPEKVNKAEAGKLRRAVRTLRKQLASSGQMYSTLDLKAMVLGVHDQNYQKMSRDKRHSVVAGAFSTRLMA